ncbi:MAG: energy transducer TonB [Gammaproteobacteria bacterium]|nr:energy transducer TonB [Gammaproteobacteria bacterium]
MPLRHTLPISILTLAGFSAPAFAQFRCDCTSVVDTCTASVDVRGSWVEVTTDTQQCARVDYFVDGQPFVSLAVEGEDRQPWVPGAAAPRVLIQSCAVCRDTAQDGGATARPGPGQRADGDASDDAADADGLQALIEVPPAYPEGARGAEGYVDVEVTVGPRGEVQEASVAAAQPPDVFDQAALAAVRRWRYPQEPGRDPTTVTERIEFRAAPAAAAATAAPAAVRRNDEGARNDCVRQGSRFDYGGLVEVGLLNACDVPIMVYGCAEGAEEYRGRWVCTTSEQQRTVLVPGGDERVGTTAMLESGDALQSHTFADRFFMSRAPNAEYWWLACAFDDEACRSAARQWTRSVDRQLASVNPQGRSSLVVARSY